MPEMSETRAHSTRKEQYKAMILEWLIKDETFDWSMTNLAVSALGFENRATIYNHVTADEVRDLKEEALKIRRRHYQGELAKADFALLKKAGQGDPVANKLARQVFEGWREGIDVDISQLDALLARELEIAVSARKDGSTQETEGDQSGKTEPE